MARPLPPLPFSAIIGQATMKRALLLNALDPGIGGVLIRGQKGTAKSTAVRSLAALLPELAVVSGCRYQCDPEDAVRLCDECAVRIAAGEKIAAVTRTMRVVELPINASEDRVVGAIDIEAAIQQGLRRFQPGVLAEANRNILYVDEVNLLDDHLVDVLLDAAAMGRNVVEREGVSISHPARFILIGTMNPEEGELRPQLLDRFGLCVDVSGLNSNAERVSVLEQDAALANDSGDLQVGYGPAEDRLRRLIAEARMLLPLVDVDVAMRQLVAAVCIDAGVGGHRADIVMLRTARAIRAWSEAELVVDNAVSEVERSNAADALQVDARDIAAAAELVLAHRRRDSTSLGGKGEVSNAAAPRDNHIEPSPARTADAQMAAVSEGAVDADDGEDADPGTAQGGNSDAPSSGHGEMTAASSRDDTMTDLFAVRKIALPRDRKTRRRSGKRSQSVSGDRRGRYVAATTAEHVTDLAFDATLRAAAPHQRQRRALAGATAAGSPALHVERQDLRQKVRRRRTGTLIVFVVDASASMDAEQRMAATKGAILSLLRDAYLRRDKVALVVFSGRTARIVLQPTSSIDLAESRLQRLGVGGTTPLTHGLLAGLKLIRTERLRDATVIPLLVLISDGRGNISLFGDEPLAEAQSVAAQFGAEHIPTLIIDSARDHTNPVLPRIPGGSKFFGGAYAFNACQDLADHSGGEYLGLFDLSQGAIVAGVQRSLQSRR